MTIRRHEKANIPWTITELGGGSVSNNDARLAVLMDIRDELQHLNRKFDCTNFLQIPFKLDHIARNTAKPRKKRKAPS